MLTKVGNGHGDPSSNPGRGFLWGGFHIALIHLGKVYMQLLSSAVGEYYGRIGAVVSGLSLVGKGHGDTSSNPG